MRTQAEMEPVFLTLDEVLALHADQIQRYGGTPGLRDEHLLASAMGTVPATFGGHFLHSDSYEMAAGYLYHIAQNHPFLDGNKRTALAASLMFLWMNGIEVVAEEDALYELVLGVAEGRTSKAEAAVFFKTRYASRDLR